MATYRVRSHAQLHFLRSQMKYRLTFLGLSHTDLRLICCKRKTQTVRKCLLPSYYPIGTPLMPAEQPRNGVQFTRLHGICMGHIRQPDCLGNMTGFFFCCHNPQWWMNSSHWPKCCARGGGQRQSGSTLRTGHSVKESLQRRQRSPRT